MFKYIVRYNDSLDTTGGVGMQVRTLGTYEDARARMWNSHSHGREHARLRARYAISRAVSLWYLFIYTRIIMVIEISFSDKSMTTEIYLRV